jgi:hypothetical protein
MARAADMMCTLKALRHIELKEGLHAGSLAEPGMVHGRLAWSLADAAILLCVIDECSEITYKVGKKTTTEWVEYFLMNQPNGIRIINPYDFKLILTVLRDK